VVAAAVGGLTTAVANGTSGLLVDGHDPDRWAKTISDLLASPAELDRLRQRARSHAKKFSWDRTTDGLLEAYQGATVGLRALQAEAVG